MAPRVPAADSRAAAARSNYDGLRSHAAAHWPDITCSPYVALWHSIGPAADPVHHEFKGVFAIEISKDPKP